MEQLRSIVRELEDGNLSLSDSLKKYESGIGFLQHCYEDLAMAERKIRQLVRVDQDGKLITQPFDDKASHPLDTSDVSTQKGYLDGKSAVKSDTDNPNSPTELAAKDKTADRFLFAPGIDSDEYDDDDDGEYDEDNEDDDDDEDLT